MNNFARCHRLVFKLFCLRMDIAAALSHKVAKANNIKNKHAERPTNIHTSTICV